MSPCPDCVSFLPRRFWRIIVLVLWLVAGSSLAVAQDVDQQQLIKTWEETAARAEEALQNGRASSDAFEIVRIELAEQRAQAETMAGAGRVTIRSLKAQIEALGPAPGKDQSEPAPIAARRKQLNDALVLVEGPAIAARQAYARANVLIEEIDALVRTRSTSDLLIRKPSPLMPDSWGQLFVDLPAFYDKISEDTLRHHLSVRGQTADVLGERILPALGIALFALLVPLGVGHLILTRLERRMKGDPASTAFLAKAAGIQILRIFLGILTGALLLAALVEMDVGPTTAHSLSGAAFVVVVIFILTNWIGNILFAPSQPLIRLVDLGDDLARACYWLSFSFATALSIEVLVDGISEDFAFAEASLSALQAIGIAINLVVLAGLARVLRAAANRIAERGKPDDDELGPGFLRTMARAVQILGFAAFLATAAGFVPLARAVLAPVMLSLTLLGLAYILHHASMVPINVAFRRQKSTASLISVLFAACLVCAGIPLLALVWGARVADISEVWRVIQNGIDIGGTRLSPKVLIVLVAIFLVGLFLTRWMQRIVDRVVLPRTRIDRGGRNAINTGLGYAGVIVSALLAISAAGLDLSNLAIIAGALSVGVGFGMQAIVSNFVSGIILLIERPIKEGDWIEVSGFSGVVRKIAVRSTRIETFDRHDVIIPNADLISGAVKNRTLSSRIGRISITLTLKPDLELSTIRQVFLQAARSNGGILPTPEPQVFLTRLAAASQEVELRCFLRDVGVETSARSDLLLALREGFRQAGHESPLV